MYQTLAGQGYNAPLKAVRGVLTRGGEALSRNPLQLQRTLDPGPVFTLNYVLRQVTRRGTAKKLRNHFPENFELAGKTGTTQRYRDSWFAGFSQNRVMSVWIGHDDNSPTGLTGATGALELWTAIANRLDVKSIRTNPPETVTMHEVDPDTWLPTNGKCTNEVEVPFVKNSKPDTLAACARDDSFFF